MDSNQTFEAIVRALPIASALVLLLGLVLLVVSVRQRQRFRRWVSALRIGASVVVVLIGAVLGGAAFITASARESFAARGQTASALPYVAASGEAADLSDFAGQVVVLNAWATWCVPCIAEMPELDALQAQHEGELTVLALSDENAETVRTWTERQDYGFEVGRVEAPEAMPEPFGGFFGVRPTTLVIDREGVVQATLIGEQTLESLEAVVRPLL